MLANGMRFVRADISARRAEAEEPALVALVDVTDPDAVAALVAAAWSDGNPSRGSSTILESRGRPARWPTTRPGAWRRVVDVNLSGAFHYIRLPARHGRRGFRADLQGRVNCRQGSQSVDVDLLGVQKRGCLPWPSRLPRRSPQPACLLAATGFREP